MSRGLMARLRAETVASMRRGGVPCGVCSLPPQILKATRALRAEGLHLSALSRTLQQRGYKVSEVSMGNHFRDHESRKR